MCFSSLFNCKGPIVICHVFLDTLTKSSIKSCHACLNITKGKEVFSNDMSMVIPVRITYIGAGLNNIALGYISCHKLNNCNMKFQFEILKFLLLRVKLK